MPHPRYSLTTTGLWPGKAECGNTRNELEYSFQIIRDDIKICEAIKSSGSRSCESSWTDKASARGRLKTILNRREATDRNLMRPLTANHTLKQAITVNAE